MDNMPHARRFYETVFPDITWVGPQPEYNGHALTSASAFWSEVDSIIAGVHKARKDPSRPWWNAVADSPWQAYLYLLRLQYHFLAELEGAKQPLLFRGQGNVEWDLIPTLHRRSENRNFDEAVLFAFVDLIQEYYRSRVGSIPEPPLITQVGAAQHHGIPTDLLDFTPDPAIAVAFASGAQAGPQQLACVFALPLQFALERLNAMVLLPHPHVRRLYLQRGVFLGVGHKEYGALRAECIEVHFPPDPDFCVYRDGKALDYLPAEPWFQRMVEESLRWVQTNGTKKLEPADARTILNRIDSEGTHPPDFSVPLASMEDEHRRLVGFYAALTELCLWLAAVLNEDGKLVPNEHIVDEIAKYNYPFILRLVNFLDVMGANSPGSLTEAFRTSIRRHGQVTNRELSQAIGRISSAIKFILMQSKERQLEDPQG